MPDPEPLINFETAVKTRKQPGGNAEAAHRRLAQLSGRTHRLLTGVAILGPAAPPYCFTTETRMTLRALTSEEIAAYVETEEWRGCAGGYRVEGRGITLMERIEGDHFNIIGLPLLDLLRALRERGAI